MDRDVGAETRKLHDSVRRGLDNAKRLGAVLSWVEVPRHRAGVIWVVEHRGQGSPSRWTTPQVQGFLEGVAAANLGLLKAGRGQGVSAAYSREDRRRVGA